MPKVIITHAVEDIERWLQATPNALLRSNRVPAAM